jgi:hypothetical protein
MGVIVGRYQRLRDRGIGEQMIFAPRCRVLALAAIFVATRQPMLHGHCCDIKASLRKVWGGL